MYHIWYKVICKFPPDKARFLCIMFFVSVFVSFYLYFILFTKYLWFVLTVS